MTDFNADAAMQGLVEAAEKRALKPGVPQTDVKNDHISVALPPSVGAEGVTAALARLGYLPGDFTVKGVKYRQVGEVDQLTVDLIPAVHRLRAARTEGPRYTPASVTRDASEPRLVIFLPDQQLPYMNMWAHELSLRWIEEAQPDEIVNMGDLVNFSVIGTKHDWNPLRVPDPIHETQMCIDRAYEYLREVREAGRSSLRKMVWIPGNHEQHLVKAIIRAEDGKIADLRRAGDPDGFGVMTLRNLCRLDELGVEWVSHPLGDWPLAKYMITPNLGAIHGEIVKGDAGASALATIKKLNHSCVIGHIHSQAEVFKTVHNSDGTFKTLVGIEAGTLCDINGQGYTSDPDWQQGAASAWVYPDGTFSASLAKIVENGRTLLWEGMAVRRDVRGVSISGRRAA